MKKIFLLILTTFVYFFSFTQIEKIDLEQVGLPYFDTKNGIMVEVKNPDTSKRGFVIMYFSKNFDNLFMHSQKLNLEYYLHGIKFKDSSNNFNVLIDHPNVNSVTKFIDKNLTTLKANSIIYFVTDKLQNKILSHFIPNGKDLISILSKYCNRDESIESDSEDGVTSCNSGGPGSTSCSLNSSGSSCSVSCGSGYYSCCVQDAQANSIKLCKCLKQ